MNGRFDGSVRRLNFRCWQGIERSMQDWDEMIDWFEQYCRTYDMIGGLKR